MGKEAYLLIIYLFLHVRSSGNVIDPTVSFIQLLFKLTMYLTGKNIQEPKKKKKSFSNLEI